MLMSGDHPLGTMANPFAAGKGTVAMTNGPASTKTSLVQARTGGGGISSARISRGRGGYARGSIGRGYGRR
jgi:hypothetical protein